MPVDADAAGRTTHENKNSRLDLGNLMDTPGQRMKELVNLDSFKNSISNICQLWLSGLPAQPRRYEQWRSKIVQHEKISFVDPTITTNSTTDPPTTTGPNTLLTMQSISHGSTMNGSKSAPAEITVANPHHISSKRNKRKEPYELLEEMYKHTDDPLPEYEKDILALIFIEFFFQRIIIIFSYLKWRSGLIKSFHLSSSLHEAHVLLAIFL
jgi:hypothetical protein